MKEPLWINPNVRLIRTFINFPVFPQSNTQVGNSLESRRPDCEHVALRSVQGALDSHRCQVRSAGLDSKACPSEEQVWAAV